MKPKRRRSSRSSAQFGREVWSKIPLNKAMTTSSAMENRNSLAAKCLCFDVESFAVDFLSIGGSLQSR